MKLNRSYERTAEFRERQGNLFDQGVLFVFDVATRVHASLSRFARGFLKSFRMPTTPTPAPQQLSLLLQT